MIIPGDFDLAGGCAEEADGEGVGQFADEVRLDQLSKEVPLVATTDMLKGVR